MIGITSFSSYLPRYCLDRALIGAAWGSRKGSGKVSVANYDEDALTMAIEAALACIPEDSPRPDAFYFASTSAPYREKQMSSFAATACDLARDAQAVDFSGSARAGLDAVVAAVNAVRGETASDIVVAASEMRLAAPESDLEGVLGDAAAALRIGSGNVIAEFVGAHFISEEFTHLWRRDDDRFVQAFPGKFSNTFGYKKDLGEALRALLSKHSLEVSSIAHFAFFSPDARAVVDLAKSLGINPETQLISPPVGSIGSAGAADPLLGLCSALSKAKPGEWIVAGSYGDGASVTLFRTTDAVEDSSKELDWQDDLEGRIDLASYEKYLKFRRLLGSDEPGEAINNVLSHKELKQDIRFYGSRCDSCGTVQYPQSRVCISCQKRECLSDHKLGRRGSIFTLTVDHLIANLEHPLPMVVVDLDGGGRVYLQMTDFFDSEAAIGLEVQRTFRLLHEGGGNRNYYWKARPIR